MEHVHLLDLTSDSMLGQWKWLVVHRSNLDSQQQNCMDYISELPQTTGVHETGDPFQRWEQGDLAWRLALLGHNIQS
jgi:hypothetical protein